MAQQPLVGQGLLIIEASRAQTRHSVGLPWTKDQPDRDLYITNTQHLQETDINAPGGIRTRKIPVSERQQTHALDGAATGISSLDTLKAVIDAATMWKSGERYN
jgi:hypothetical protein